MTHDIQVILLEDIPSVGRAGDVVSVAEGYARNFLFAQGKAALATETVRKQRKQIQLTRDAQAVTDLKALQAQAEQLSNTELMLPAKVKEGEEIYGSITKKHIADEFKKQAGIMLRPAQIELKKSLTKLGSVDVTLHLSPAVDTTIRVTVVSEEGRAKDTDEDE